MKGLVTRPASRLTSPSEEMKTVPLLVKTMPSGSRLLSAKKLPLLSFRGVTSVKVTPVPVVKV